MYRQISPDQHRIDFGLPKEYSVSGFLCLRSWKREEEIESLKRALTDLNLKFELSELPNFLRRMVEVRIGIKKIWFDVPYGGAMLSEYVQLACLFGSKKNILIGYCGGLSPDINNNDIIIPSWSFGNESSTRMYSDNINNRHFPDAKLASNLKGRLTQDLNVFDGPTTTCQAMLAETWENIQTWSREGYLGVEMEASTLFAVSSHFRIPSAALLFVADNLINKETVRNESYINLCDKRTKTKEDLLKAAINELLEE